MKFLDENVKQEKAPESAPVEEGISFVSYLKAGYSLLYIRTEEDNRAVDMVKSAIVEVPALRDRVHYGEWRATTGLLMVRQPGGLDLDSSISPTCDGLVDAFKVVGASEEPHVVCFHNVRQFISNPQVIQSLKDSMFKAKIVGSHIVLIGAGLDIPSELQNSITVYDLDLPTAQKFREDFGVLCQNYSSMMKACPEDRVLDIAARSAVGMTELQGENAVALSLATRRELDPAVIQLEKEQAIKRSDVLEFIRVKDSMDQLGGFRDLKDWVRKRRNAFTSEAIEYGLKFPKGILLVGIPGSGKSLSARCISQYMELPLLKLDMGRIFKSLVGASESSVRSALKTAEAVAPVVLWIEEIEKSMAGSQSSGSSDSGTTARVMSTVLTWMQENKKPIFIVACMTGDTVIARPDGSLPTIGTAQVGPVLSADFTGSGIVPSEADLKVTPLAKVVHEITTTGSFLTCTPNHPFFVGTEDGSVEEVPAELLSVGEYVAAPYLLPEPTKANLRLTRPRLAPNASEVRLPDELTPEVGYWLGYLTGDGGANRKQDSDIVHRIQWSDLNLEMAKLCSSHTERIFGKKATIVTRKGAEGYYIYLDSSSVGRWVTSLFPESIATGGPNRSVPQLICRSPNEVVASYLSGLFDAEGSCLKDGVSMVTTSYVLYQQISMLLRRFGIQGSLDRNRSNTSFTTGMVYRVAIKSKEDILAFAENIGFKYPDKARKLAGLVEVLQDKPPYLSGGSMRDIPVPYQLINRALLEVNIASAVLPYYTQSVHTKGRVSRKMYEVWIVILEQFGCSASTIKALRTRLAFRWDRVKKNLRSEREVPVFDLRVPGLHNYVASGLIVHNTANNVEALPPELLRKGRFSEIWGVQEPDSEERAEIWKIHINKIRPGTSDSFDVPALVKLSDNYTGAEIEGIVEEALFDAWDDGRREINTTDLKNAIHRVVPQSVTCKERLDVIRTWMRQKVRYVSGIKEVEVTKKEVVNRKVRAAMTVDQSVKDPSMN